MRRMCIASYATGTPDPSLVSRQERLPQLHTRLELVARARIKRAFHAADQIQFCRVDIKTFRIEHRLVADMQDDDASKDQAETPESDLLHELAFEGDRTFVDARRRHLFAWRWRKAYRGDFAHVRGKRHRGRP